MNEQDKARIDYIRAFITDPEFDDLCSLNKKEQDIIVDMFSFLLAQLDQLQAENERLNFILDRIVELYPKSKGIVDGIDF